MAKTTSNLATLKSLIATSHDDFHNRRALSKQDFLDLGSTEQSFDSWCRYCEDLRTAAAEYNKVAQDKDADSKTIQTKLGAVWSEWRRVLKAGTEEEFNKNFFVRKNDAHLIAEWAGLTAISTAKGKIWGCNTSTNFRRNVETIIGIRMAGNAVLDDEKRDLIVGYEQAVETKKRNEEALKDSKDKTGKVVYGLESTAKYAKQNLEEQKELLDNLGDSITDKAKETLLTSFQNAVDTADKAVKAAKDAITTAEKTIKEKQKAYDKAIALIKSVGDSL